jgi:hypothetical protein
MGDSGIKWLYEAIIGAEVIYLKSGIKHLHRGKGCVYNGEKWKRVGISGEKRG